MAAFALDASVAAAWCFPDEQTPYTDWVLSSIPGSRVVAPQLWAYEVRNSVLLGLRRGRIGADHAQDFLAALDALPIRLVEPASFNSVFGLAECYNLTIYDAAYVELALRENLKLATLDAAMRRAAVKDLSAVIY